MNIKLKSLHIKHFKGIKDFKLVADGKNALVFGDNGKGKTTLMDAFLWLLFDKDSTDRTNFTVKPQDNEGNDIHHLQTQVEAELLINGQVLKLKKMQEEKWTKRRGSVTEELTGNTVSYWRDEVPVKAGEYKQKISELIDENIFRMITNPMYFNTKIKWEDRRKILLEICGDATDEEVIASNKDLSKLAEVLNGRSIDDYKKVLADKIKGLEKERTDIPPRIDELTLSIPQEETDYTEVEKELQGYKDMLTGIELEMTNASSIVDAFRKKQQEIYGLKGKLENLKSKINAEAGADRRKFLEEKAELEDAKYVLESSIKTLKLKIEQSQEVIEVNKKARQQLVEEWKKLKQELTDCLAEEFIEPEEGIFNCPTCGQYLPETYREIKLEEMKRRFEESKQVGAKNINSRLEHNVSRGQRTKENTIAEQNFIEQAQAEIQAKEKSLSNILTDLQRIEAEIQKPIQEPNYTDYPEYVELENQITELQAELDKPIEDTTVALRQQKQEIQQEIDNCNSILSSRDRVAKDKKRIEELKAEEKRIAAKITELEGHEYLLEQFVVSKVNLLEDSINSRFKHVKFKMFNQQINGGIAETCEALVNTNGSYVPFADANSAGRINAGIDIINALCGFYGVQAPIWIDNRESVVKLADTESQIISLVVSEKDKVLRVEVEE